MAKHLAPTFGAIDIEDVSSPNISNVVKALQSIEIPVFSDDQQGSSAVVLAALTNALAVVDKKISGIKVVIYWAGAAGIAVTDMFLYVGVKKISVLITQGIVSPENPLINSFHPPA